MKPQECGFQCGELIPFLQSRGRRHHLRKAAGHWPGLCGLAARALGEPGKWSTGESPQGRRRVLGLREKGSGCSCSSHALFLHLLSAGGTSLPGPSSPARGPCHSRLGRKLGQARGIDGQRQPQGKTAERPRLAPLSQMPGVTFRTFWKQCRRQVLGPESVSLSLGLRIWV